MEEKGETKVHLAVVGGFFASTGSLLGKLAGGAAASSLGSLLLKSILFLLMVLSNTLGCTLFVKALHGSGSSLPATIASAATNYICSALIGFLVFGETTTLLWWSGASLVMLGLMLICYSSTGEDSTAEEKLKHE